MNDKKSIKGINYKSIKASVKAVDMDSRIVEGYFSSFGNVDSDADRGNKGMFLKSIQERGPRSESNRKIAHLAFHDLRRPVGNIIELEEDSIGLRFRSEMGTHSDGEDALKMYRDGIIKEHSYGFEYISDKMKFTPLDESQAQAMGLGDHEGVKMYGGIFDLYEVKLYEGSFVTFGANSETPNLSAMKSQADIDKAREELNERMEVFIKAIKDKTYSEKYCNLFDLELKKIQKGFNDLITFEPGKLTRKEDARDQSLKNDQQILSQLKNIL